MFGRRILRWTVTFGRFSASYATCEFDLENYQTINLSCIDGRIFFPVSEFGAAMTNTATKSVKILQIVSLSPFDFFSFFRSSLSLHFKLYFSIRGRLCGNVARSPRRTFTSIRLPHPNSTEYLISIILQYRGSRNKFVHRTQLMPE